MKPYAILVIACAIVLVATAFAAETNITGGMSFTGKGPSGVMIPLGFEKVGISNAQAAVYYNWLSISILVAIAAMASKYTTRFFAVLIPALAALLVYMGWFTNVNTGQPQQMWGLIVVCAVLAAMVYMKGSLHEKFGIAGPGSMLFNIVFYVLIMQATVGFVESTHLWDGIATTPVVSNEYSNIDLGQQIDNIQNQGGILNDISQIGAIMMDMTVGVIKMFISMAASIAFFSVVIGILYPWIPQSAFGIGLLAILQLGIYIIYYMAYVRFIYKPIGEGDF